MRRICGPGREKGRERWRREKRHELYHVVFIIRATLNRLKLKWQNLSFSLQLRFSQIMLPLIHNYILSPWGLL
jgi:hypothetical protein